MRLFKRNREPERISGLADVALSTYLPAMESVPGWFLPDDAVCIAAYGQIIAGQGVRGDTLEIGVFAGKSSILIAALRAEGGRFVAIDVFGNERSGNREGSGASTMARFLDTMTTFHGSTDFVELHARPSDEVRPSELGTRFAVCHVDGSHRAEAVYHDMQLVCQVAQPGALIVVDDYLNREWPGVTEGVARFVFENPEAMAPLALGINKGLFQKRPAPQDTNDIFAQRFPSVPRRSVSLFECDAFWFDQGFLAHVELGLSTIRTIVPRVASSPPGETPAV